MMRFLAAGLAAALILLQPGPGHGFEAEPPPARPATDLSMDALFERLAASGSQSAAAPYESEIVRRFHRSGSATADLLLLWAGQAIEDRAWGPALDLLDRLTVMKPGFAEAWNKRAMVHLRRNDYGKALADLERALRLEPRHFRAMARLGLLLREIGEEEAAMEALHHALAIHPQLRDARRALDRLQARAARREI